MFSDFLITALNNCGLGVRPGYYSGRGANAGDLNNRHLDAIYDAIVTHVNEKAGKHFVQMVADIPVLSATDFLLTLAMLGAHDFNWHKNLLGSQKGFHAENMGEAWGTVLTALSGGDRREDSTVSIRREFLWKHGVKDPRAKEDKFGMYGGFDHHDNFMRMRRGG